MSDPRPDEFVRFHDLLTEHAPDGYTPWYFRCREGSKAPATSHGSWKDESARLSATEAVEWMESGGNVGIAGTDTDALVNVDIDDEDETTADDLKDTLIARSRSRTGVHGWYFAAPDEDIPNIPTDDAGEVRTNWQYVVAPGSYVDTDPQEVPKEHRDNVGYYTVERENPVPSLRFDELPDVFIDHHQQTQQADTDAELAGEPIDPEPAGGEGDGTALFNISGDDVMRKEGGSTDTDDRFSSIFHGSDTDANTSLSSKGLIQCWRHNVTHNGYQALVVLSDYSGGCEQVGAPHSSSNAGSSCLSRDDGAAVWHAWKYAKQNGYIPEDDPVPYSALKHLCRARELCAVSEIPADPDESLPAHAYDMAIRTIETNDDLDAGRVQTDDIDDSESSPKEPQTPPSSKDASGDDAEMAEADGGAAAASPSPDSSDESDDSSVSWADIRNMLRSAEDADDRRTPRFEAAMKIDDEHDFANLIESDTLYAYQPDAGIYDSTGEALVRELLGEGLEEQFTATAKNQALEHIRGRNSLRQEEMGGPAWKIAAENCVVDLDDNEQLEHDPQFRFMSQLGCEFDPDAEAPRWEQFLEEVVPTKSDRKKLQEFAGYTLHHWGLPFHKALFLVGPTASGKSTFLDTINAMLGEGTTASLTPQQMTSERFAGAELFEKWANIRNDIPKATVENTGTFKEIVGGDPLKAEKKYQDPFRFEPTAKMLFSANQLPETEVDDEAFYRRILLTPFPETVPVEQRDKHLDEKLQSELSGVLNWAIKGLTRLIDQGGFTADRSPGHTADTWQKWGDSVSRFAADAIEEASSDEAIPKSKLYAAYLEYCRQEGIPSDTQHSMTRGLKEEGFNDGRVYVDGDRERSILAVNWTGRGEELLDSADDRSASGDDGRASGLDSF